MEMGDLGFLACMIVVEEGAAVPGGDTNGLHGEFIGSRAWESVAWMVDIVIYRRVRGRLCGRRVEGGGGGVGGRRMQRRMRGGGVQYVAGGMRRMQLGSMV